MMEVTAIAAWTGVALLSVTSIGGWVVTWVRNSKSQSAKFGKLEGKVDALSTRVESQGTSINNLTTRIDNLINNLTKKD